MTLKASALRSPRSPYVPINHMNSLVTHLVYLCLASILLLGITNRPSSVLAAPNTKQLAKSAFKKGKVAFDEGRYSDALLSFDEAYQHFPLPLMLYNIANVYERLNLYPQALTKYKAFIRTGKDSNGEAEKKMKVIEEKIKDWPEVLLTSTPSGASLRLYSDEHPILGQTPLKQKLPVLEELPIYLTPAEGETIKKFVTVRPDLLRQTININLPKRAAYIRVIGSPSVAQVKSGDVRKNGLPALLKLSVGDHDIDLLASGYLPIKKSVSLRSVHTKEAPLTLEIQLQSSEGVTLVALNVSADGALLFIDGLPQGQSPFNDPIELSEGEHLIELKGPKGEEFQETLSLKAGETTQLTVDFDTAKLFLTKERVTLGLVSLGGASLLTGLVLGSIALNANGNLEDCRAHELCARRQGEIDRAQAVRTYALSADILTSLGLIIGGTGGVMYWLDHRSTPVAPPIKPSVQIGSLPGGASLQGLVHF